MPLGFSTERKRRAANLMKSLSWQFEVLVAMEGLSERELGVLRLWFASMGLLQWMNTTVV